MSSSAVSKPTTTTEQWETRYQQGETPWDTGQPDEHLVAVVTGRPIPPGSALEIGCGTGTNAVWLAERGFEVTATDVSATALAKAKARASSSGASVRWLQRSFPSPAHHFDFAFDRGCFHTQREVAQREAFVAAVAERLNPAGLWLSIIGSTDGPPRDTGPPRLSAEQVAAAVEPRFEILSLTAGQLEAQLERPPRVWIALLQQRDGG